jgi:two-component system alkaline phosphatase synthesis response regulator PhoP
MPYTVLVIDDQWSMQELARLVLQAAGYRVLVAGDGATGLSLARTEHPDLLVLDLRMPGMHGLDVLRSLQQDPQTARIPVIVITLDDADRQLVSGLHPAGTLHKPFRPPELLKAVRRVLPHKPMALAM